ncbi:hypothetical protein DPMN_010411 [Dreissena polymorpha]|uniref:Uncharacterized protein n=1 Tax=Dreissena polymorpha TaxID=45954 RepID=A0A9D4N247_DREPO|nr:hypothetical protein DPMN_010411 [Dreissena polymorpha]
MMADLVKSFLNGTRLLETGMLASLFVNATLAKFGNSLPRTMFSGKCQKAGVANVKTRSAQSSSASSAFKTLAGT